MDIVILDLEWNAAYSNKLNGYINEIIEFGAVMCDENLNEKDSFSCLVRPQVGKRMNPYTAELTSLTVETLSHGITFPAAVKSFKKWLGEKLNSFVIMTWGNSDVLALIENCRYFTGSEKVPFLSRYCDLQPFVQKKLGVSGKEQLGLSAAAELLKLDVSQLEHHRALDDSRETLKILQAVYDESIESFAESCGDEFYRRITFKTRYVTDIQSPLIKPENLRFPCPKCGGKTAKISKWSLHNKSLHADFKCRDCGARFNGRLTVKEKYDGIVVRKKATSLPVIESARKSAGGEVKNMRLEIGENGAGVLRFKCYDGVKGVNAAFSTRIGGVSKNEFADMNLGFTRGDEDENVSENYRLFCNAAGFNTESLVTGAQDHHTNIRRVTANERGIGIWREKDMESVDGLCTDDENVTLVIYCADCVPLYFYDPEHRAIGLAHAGWRGTAAGMAKVMTERMAHEFGTRPEALLVAIGPSICKDCFEVDEPVAREFLSLENSGSFVFGPRESSYPCSEPQMKYNVDLWECNRQFLLSAGVKEENIGVAGVCTMCESDLLFSHRKTRGKRGSNAAFLSLKA